MVSRLSIGGCCCGDCRYFGFAVFPGYVQQAAADLAAIYDAWLPPEQGSALRNPFHWQSTIETNGLAPMVSGFPANSRLYIRYKLEDLPTRTWRKVRHWTGNPFFQEHFSDGRGLSGLILGTPGGSTFDAFRHNTTVPGLRDWWYSYGYYLPTTGSDEFAAMQAYLASGGTVALRLPTFDPDIASEANRANIVGRLNTFFAAIGSGCRVADPVAAGLFKYRFAPVTYSDSARTHFAMMHDPSPNWPVVAMMNYSVSETVVPTEQTATQIKLNSAPRGGYLGPLQFDQSSWPLYLSAPDAAVQQYARLVPCDFDPDTDPPSLSYTERGYGGRVFFEPQSSSAMDTLASYDPHVTSGPAMRMPIAVHERLPGGGSLLLESGSANHLNQKRTHVRMNWALSQMSEDCRIFRSTHRGTSFTATPEGRADDDWSRYAIYAGGPDPAAASFAELDHKTWCGPLGTGKLHTPIRADWDGSFTIFYGGPSAQAVPGQWHSKAGDYRAGWTTPEQPVDGPDQHEGIQLTVGASRICDPTYYGRLPFARFQKIGNDSRYFHNLQTDAYHRERGWHYLPHFEMYEDDRAFWLEWYAAKVAPFVPLNALSSSDAFQISQWLNDPEEPPANQSVRNALLNVAPINLDQVDVSDNADDFENEWFMITGQPQLTSATHPSGSYNLRTVRPVIYQDGEFFFDPAPVYREWRHLDEFYYGPPENPFLRRSACLGRLANFRSESGNALKYGLTDGKPFLPLAQFESGPLEWNETAELNWNGLSFDFIRRTPPSRFAEIYGALPTL